MQQVLLYSVKVVVWHPESALQIIHFRTSECGEEVVYMPCCMIEGRRDPVPAVLLK
jgi:hypothetical protein